MRHVTKGLLGTAAFLVTAGLILALTGWAMGADTSLDLDLDGRRVRVGTHGISDWNDGEYAVSAGEAHSGGARALEPFHSVDITADLADISFEAAEDYGVELRWYGAGMALDYEVAGDTLSVYTDHEILRQDTGKRGRVVIYLPEDAKLDSVSIQADMGDIRMENRRVDSLSIESDMGRTQLRGMTVETLDMSSDMGLLSALDCTVTETLTASNNMGDIEISGDIRGALDLKNDLGGITLRTAAPVSDFGYELEVDMGRITVDGRTYTEHTQREGGPHSLFAQTSMGSIDVSFSG